MKIILLLLPLSLAFATTIRVPDEIRDHGSLKVSGTAGAGQKSRWSVCQVKMDSKGFPMRRGLETCSHHDLGREVRLPAGTYRVAYERTATLISVADEPVEIVLSQLPLEKIDGSYRFYLYRDVENEEEKNKIAMEYWLGLDNRLAPNINLDYVCGKNPGAFRDRAAEDLCQKLTRPNGPNDLKATLFFKPEGLVEHNDFQYLSETYDHKGLVTSKAHYTVKRDGLTETYLVGSGFDGDFISVFPGTYAARIVSSGGHASYQKNIRVEETQLTRHLFQTK